MADATLKFIVDGDDRFSGKLEAVGAKIGDMAKKVAVAAAAAGAAVGAFATASVLKYSQVGDEVEKMAKRTGLAADAVSALRVAADASGTSIGSVENAIKRLTLNMAAGEEKGNDFRKLVEGFGYSFDEIRASNPEQVFEAMAISIGSIPDPVARADAAFRAFGKAGTDLLPMFEDGNFSMEQWREKAKALGVSFDDLSASRAAQLNDALGELKASFLGVALTVGGALAPSVIDLVNRAMPYIQTFTRWLGEVVPIAVRFLIETVGWLRQRLMELYDLLEQTGIIDMFRKAFEMIWGTFQTRLLPAIRQLIDVVRAHWDQLRPFAEFLGAVIVVAFLAVLGAVDLVIKVVAKMIEWIAKAIEAWANFKSNVVGLWNDIAAAATKIWDGIKQTIIGAINAVTKPISDFLGKIGEVKNAVSNAFANLGANLGFGGARAMGGPVSSGVAYLVGERGPEIFTPGTFGTISPIAAGGGGPVINLTLTGNTFMGGDEAARILGKQLVDYLKLNLRI